MLLNVLVRQGGLHVTTTSCNARRNNKNDKLQSSTRAIHLQSNLERIHRVGTVRGFSGFGSACHPRGSAVTSRTVRDQGAGTPRCETDAAQTSRRSHLHGYIRDFLYWPWRRLRCQQDAGLSP